MNILFVVMQVLAITYQFGTTSNRDTLLTALTEAPELLHTAGLSYAMSEEKYDKIAKSMAGSPSFVPITRKPRRLSANARFGYNLAFGGFNRSWILDGDEKEGYVLYADLNANGNLAEDPPLKFELDLGNYSLLLKTTATEKVNGKEETYPIEIKLEITHHASSDETESQLALQIYTTTHRKGIIQVGGRKIAFTLTGSQGIYDWEYNHVSFDFNGDGIPSSSESYAIWEKYVNVGDSSYEFDVDRYGRSLTLKLLKEHFPARASLQPFSQAPEFTFKDIDGKSHSLSDFRGKVVVLDFWGTWCGPCVAEAPKLAATYHQLQEQGLEIIGIHYGEDTTTVRKFTSENKMNWTHTIEGDNGAIHRLYRIGGWPTYYLIGKDGSILSNTLRPGDGLTNEIEKQFQQK